MSQSISPPPVGRRASLGAVLTFAWDNGVFTASDAMAVVGLTRSTTIDVIDELVEHGLVRELPNARAVGDYRKGRPARRFELRSDAGVIVGIDVGPDHTVTAVADLRGDVIVREHLETDLHHDPPDERRATATRAVDAALLSAGCTRDDVLALCAGVPAPVDARGQSPAHRNGFWRRMNPDLAGLFAEWVPIVRVENDASLAAIAERAAGAARGVEDFVTILSGEFLGASAVVDGNLLRGAHGGIAETVAFDRVVGVGGAWGLATRLAAWAQDPDRETPLTSSLSPRPGPDGEDVLARARTGDAAARALVARTGAVLSVVAGVFGSLFDPRRVILSGLSAADAEDLVDAARASLSLELDLPAPELVASRLGKDVVSVGAVFAALDSARSGVLDLETGWARERMPHA